jgi:hypothetical protein
MKQIPILFKLIATLALMAVATGCATNYQNKENLLVAAGFKVITPGKPEQKLQLQTLPPGKMAIVQKGGKTYYVFPDAAHNQAYVGGQQQYNAYKALRSEQKMSNENLESAEMNQSMSDLSTWNGWGAYGW